MDITNKKQLRFYILFLAGLCAGAPLSTDIYLSSMPTIQSLFHTTTEQMQLTLSLYFFSYAIAQLIWGPLSDRFGRKPIAIIGIALFFISSLFCALSKNIEYLIIARVFQGFSACSGIVVALAMVREIWGKSPEMHKIVALVMGIMLTAPLIAPLIGSQLLTYINWEANFYFLAAFSLILFISAFFIEETNQIPKEQLLHPRDILSAYYKQLSHKPYLLPVIAMTASFSTLFAFVSASSFIYIKIVSVILKTVFPNFS